MQAKLRLSAMSLLALLVLVGVSGCQYSFPFEISGVVRAADGGPLAGVRVTLNAGGIVESSFPVVTGPDGTFKARVRIRDIEFMPSELPKWSLELSKDGYEKATVEISPKQPESPTKTTFISAKGILKAK